MSLEANCSFFAAYYETAFSLVLTLSTYLSFIRPSAVKTAPCLSLRCYALVVAGEESLVAVLKASESSLNNRQHPSRKLINQLGAHPGKLRRIFKAVWPGGRRRIHQQLLSRKLLPRELFQLVQLDSRRRVQRSPTQLFPRTFLLHELLRLGQLDNRRLGQQLHTRMLPYNLLRLFPRQLLQAPKEVPRFLKMLQLDNRLSTQQRLRK